MCKYCMRTWADYTGDANDTFFADIMHGLNVELAISHKADVPTIYVYSARSGDGPDEMFMEDVRIHYCPFCGQKLDLVEVGK